MWPRIGPIPTYGLLYLASMLMHFLVSWCVARRAGLERRVWIAASICYSVSTIFGAKLLYDVHHSQLDLRALFSANHYMQGGFWGALLVYLALGVPLVLLLTSRKRSAVDLIALSIPVPMILAKLGCLLNGCCYGRPCSMPWAITFPEGSHAQPPGVPLHPTQVYDIILMVLLLLVFRALKEDRWRGTMLLWFLAIYGFGRAGADAFRGDIDRYIYLGPITLTQLLCLAAATISILLLIVWTRLEVTGNRQRATLSGHGSRCESPQSLST